MCQAIITPLSINCWHVGGILRKRQFSRCLVHFSGSLSPQLNALSVATGEDWKHQVSDDISLALSESLLLSSAQEKSSTCPELVGTVSTT